MSDSAVPSDLIPAGVHRVIVFYTVPADQPNVVKSLCEGIERFVATFDGFVSATILVSTDGTRVINYALWRDEASWLAMENDPASAAGLNEPFRRSRASDLHTYRVERVIPPTKDVG